MCIRSLFATSSYIETDPLSKAVKEEIGVETIRISSFTNLSSAKRRKILKKWLDKEICVIGAIDSIYSTEDKTLSVEFGNGTSCIFYDPNIRPQLDYGDLVAIKGRLTSIYYDGTLVRCELIKNFTPQI